MRILLIEDDQDLCEIITYALDQQGYAVDSCHEGDDGFRWAKSNAYDVIILDRLLPRMDGLTVLQKIRAEGIGTPVLMMTALGEVEQKVEGLDSGADDYVVKPFSNKELLARVRALCRRPREWDTKSTVDFADLHYDFHRLYLQCGSNQCSLSKREGDLLEALLQAPQHAIPRITLFSRVWGSDAEVEEGNLENYIHFLRRRLRAVGSRCCIKTVRGVGYMLEDSQESQHV